MTIIEIKLYLREPAAIFFTMLFPLMLLFIYGSIYGNAPLIDGFGVVDLYISGLIAMIIVNVTIVGMPISISVYRERGILRRFLATPLRPIALIGANIIVSFLMSGFSSALTILVAKLAFNLRFSGDIFSTILAIIISIASFVPLGFLLAGLPASARTTQTVSMAVFFFMFFLSGAAIPVEEFSPLIKNISEYNPLTYVVNLLQNLWVGKTLYDLTKEISILGVIFIVATFISAETFRWK